MSRTFWICLFILFLSVPTIFPLFQKGFFTMHDDTQVVRVSQMYDALVDGQFPVRWVSDLGYGYGYPLFNFYGPLPYYFGALCMFLGVSSLVATKIMFGVGILGAAIGMFILAKKMWGTFPAIFAAILYEYAPYHAVDIYVRGAVSEVWAMAIVPFICIGIVDLFTKKSESKTSLRSYYSSMLVIAVSYSLLIITHNITAMLVSLFIIVGIIIFSLYTSIRFFLHRVFWSYYVRKLFLLCISLGIGLCFSAFFWAPAFFEAKYTNVNSVITGSANYRDHFVYLEQLWDSPWGFGGSTKGKADGLSFKVGKIHIFLSLFSLLMLAWQRKAQTAKRGLIVYAVYLVGTILFALFMTNQLSQPLWEFIPILAFIQYPWRLLLFIVFGVSLLGAGFFTLSKNIFISFLWIPLLFAVIYVNSKYFVPQYRVILDQDIYKSDVYGKWWKSRISDEYMPKDFVKPLTSTDIVTDKFILDSPAQKIEEIVKTLAYTLVYTSSTDTNLHVNLAYFPGWNVLLDKKNTFFSISNSGIDVAIPKGKHIVEIKRRNTLIESMSNIVSLFSFILIFGTMMGSKYIYGNKTKR